MKSLNKMAQRIHGLNEKWWIDIETGERLNRNKGELIALIHSEVSEAWDGEVNRLMDDHLPHREMAEVEMADTAIRIFDYCGGFKIELEDEIDPMPGAFNKYYFICKIHSQISEILELERKGLDGVAKKFNSLIESIIRYCRAMNFDLDGTIEEKLAYNQQRADHKHEARKEEGGKKF